MQLVVQYILEKFLSAYEHDHHQEYLLQCCFLFEGQVLLKHHHTIFSGFHRKPFFGTLESKPDGTCNPILYDVNFENCALKTSFSVS